MAISKQIPDSDTVTLKGFTVRTEFRRMAAIMRVYYVEDKGVFSSTFELHGDPSHVGFIKRWIENIERDETEERRMRKLHRHAWLRKLFHLELV